MNVTTTIIRNPSEEPLSMDYQALRAAGIRLAQQLAGHAWTDFNAHDPGITLLEQLCYAITELGYRAGHSMPDLLAGRDSSDSGLPGPGLALTSAPVTLLDLRRLALDVDGVRNAWIEPVASPEPALEYHEGERELRIAGQTGANDRYAASVTLRGLYRVLVAPSSFSGLDGTAVRRNVLRALHAHRPLCTDFAEVRLVESEDVRVQAAIEIAPAHDPAAVLDRILDVLADHIAPTPRFSSLADMLAAGRTVDEIYAGPRLRHGFLDDAELRRLARKEALRTSDIIREIMDIPGVRVVHHLALASTLAGTDEYESWILPLDAGRAPRFDYQKSAITLIRDGLEVAVDQPGRALAFHDRQTTAAAAHLAAQPGLEQPPPAGRQRNLARYTSLLHLLPDCYGAGPQGLPDSAPPERKAQQKQLRAYLQFFDQILCNAFAQLGHARRLLSGDGDIEQTYASQAVPGDELELHRVYQRDESAHTAWLASAVRNPVRSHSSVERSNRFLDHLLSRYAELHADYAPHVAVGQSARAGLARDKQALLRDYPRISGARGTGFDYTRPVAGDNRSGLALRIERALGLDPDQGERFVLIEHILFRPMAEDRNQLGVDEVRPIPLLAAAATRDPYSLQLTLVFPGWPGRFARAGFRQLVAHTVRAHTPAHLSPSVRWLDAAAWSVFEQAHADWLTFHRSYWVGHLGLPYQPDPGEPGM